MLKLLEQLESRLSSKYEQITINSRNCFSMNDGTVVRLTGIPDYDSIVVEFAESRAEAEKNLFEDGDMISLKEGSETALFNRLLEVIEAG